MDKNRLFVRAGIIAIWIACGAIADDMIKLPTLIQAIYNDDVLGRCDIVCLAMSIHKMENGKYRILPQEGDLFYADMWIPYVMPIKNGEEENETVQ